MDELFCHLEAQIKALILQCESLKQINSKLRQSKSLLIREKEQLLSKHKIAISHIENMVSRLKTIEKPL
ncbi:MAG: TIGR02449 family protein [Gammaproteobacteria bacterium]|nr:TIGR02449 family protein [Gammaproteobacteria bacterium]